MPYLPWLFPHLVAPSSDGRNRVLTAGPRFGGSVFVVPRGMCQYSRRTMPRTDAKGREAARHQARFESRFAAPDVIALSAHNSASPGDVVVWSWDKARLEALTGQKNPRALPETLARDELRSGVRLIEGLDGYEGEIWVNSEVIASRWWREPPARDAWSEFLMGARTQFPGADLWDMDIPDSPPTPQRPVWKSNVAWVDDNWRAAAARITPARLAVIVGVAALAPVSCQTARFATLSAETQSLTATVEAGRAEAGEWLAQRRRAQRDAQQIIDAEALGDDIAVLYAPTDLGTVLQEHSARVAQIRYLDGEMQVTLAAGPRDNLASLITKLEATPSWAQVRMESGGSQLVGSIEETDAQGVREPPANPRQPAPAQTPAPQAAAPAPAGGAP